MTAMTDYLEDKWVDHLLGTSAYAAPTGGFAKIHTGAPGESAAANASTETTRKAISVATASGLAIASNAVLEWLAVAVSATETINGLSIWDDLTVGNPLFAGVLTAPVTNVDPGDDLRIASGGLILTASGAFTTFSANEMLDHTFGNGAYAMPTGQFVKFHLGDPGNAGTANPAAETTRVDCGPFSASSGGTSDNDAAINLASVAATETATHISIWDALTVGNALLKGALTTPKNFVAGDNVEFAPGELGVTFA